MLSIFIYQRKYSKQSHGVCLRLIEQAVANVGKFCKYSRCQQFRMDKIVHVKYVLSKFTFNSKTLSVNVKISITRFEVACSVGVFWTRECTNSY